MVDQLLVLQQFAGLGAASPEGGRQVAGMLVVVAAASELDFQAEAGAGTASHSTLAKDYAASHLPKLMKPKRFAQCPVH